MNHEEYEWYKANGICCHCRKERAIKGKTLCLVCNMDNNERDRNRKRVWNPERDKQRYEECKKNGICTTCKKRKATRGLKCTECYARIRNKQLSKTVKRSERTSNNMCYICGKKPCMDGKGVCSDCYKVREKSISRIMYMPTNPKWKRDNNLVFKENR